MRATLAASRIVVVVLLFAGHLALAQDGSMRRDGGSRVDRASAVANDAPDENAPLSERRAWVLAEMLEEFADADRDAEIVAKVAQMSPERVDALVKLYQKRDERFRAERANEARRRLATSQAYRDLLVRQYQNRLQAARAGGRPVGYAPVITVLPEGTSLGASAIVSPDRRYVRMTLQPFFSTVNRVDTFNFRTGQTSSVWSNPHYRRNVWTRRPRQSPVYHRR
jgi:hypothetical protein